MLFFGASILSARITSIAIHEEISPRRAPFSGWLKTPWFWWVLALLVFGGFMLVWPSAVQLWNTGHTDVHWSRFVVAMSCFGTAASLCIIWGIDRLLNLVESRVEYHRTLH